MIGIPKLNKYVLFLIYFILFVTLSSCAKEKINPPLATFDHGIVSQNEYIDLYLYSTIYKPDVFPTEENLRELVDRLAIEKISLLQAEEENIDTTKAFNDTYARDERRILYQQYVKTEMISKVITDSLVRRFYNTISPQYRMAYIMRPFDETSSEKFIDSQKDTIEYVYKLLHNGGDFKQLAKKYSQETTSKDKGGDLGYVIEESLGDAKLREVMASLKVNTYSKPFRGYSGYYILYKGDKREVSVPPFEETRGQIWQTLYRTRRHNIKDLVIKRLEKLKPQYHYKVNERTIKKITIKAGGNTNTPNYKALRFEKLDKQDMLTEIASYDGGSIKVGEIFKNPKTDPINLYELRKDLDSISEQHLFALEAKKIKLERMPEVTEELAKIRDTILRSIYYQRQVRDKAAAKADSLRALEGKKSQAMNQQELQAQYFAGERSVNEAYEKNLKEKYHFKYITGNFDQALSIAEKKKEIQNKEREEKEKNK
jgi:parvulin-like peptidyl-prolyl isomerase